MINKFILGILLTSNILIAENITSSEFWKQDKLKHGASTALISFTTSKFAQYNGSSKLEGFFIGISTAILIGTLKEYLDGNNPLKGTEDIGDMYANTAGALMGSSLAFISFELKF